jgi:lysophospholipid acyltransferase (LPLAT)-like uncharacterized protein
MRAPAVARRLHAKLSSYGATCHAALLARYLRLAAKTATVTWSQFPDTSTCVWACWHTEWVAVLVGFLASVDARQLPVFIGLADRRGAAIASAYASQGGRALRMADPRRPPAGGDRLRDIVACLTSGNSCLITPDGPFGPLGIPRPGAQRAADAASVPLIWITAEICPHVSLFRWDRLRIPMPFSTITLRCHVVAPLHRGA